MPPTWGNEFQPLPIETSQDISIHAYNMPDRQYLYFQMYPHLGYANPYGARLQYLVYVTRPERQLVGCVQFSSPAWQMKARDQWIGWDDATPTRGNHLQHVVNNSRFLVLASLSNLSSMLLSSVLKRAVTGMRATGLIHSLWKSWWGGEIRCLQSKAERGSIFLNLHRFVGTTEYSIMRIAEYILTR